MVDNYVNGDAPERIEHPEDCGCDFCNLNYGHIKCGYCGELKENRGLKACNKCLDDIYISDFISGK